MVENELIRCIRILPAGLAVLVLGLSGCVVPAAHAQGLMRSPTINIGPRLPSIPSVDNGPRISVRPPNLNVTARVPHLTARMAVQPTLPYARYSPNLYPSCPAAERAADGECLDQALSSGHGHFGGGGGRKGPGTGGRRGVTQAATNLRTIAGELVAEIDGALSDAQADELARRHGLARISSQNLPLLGATIGLFRITDRRRLDIVSREFAADASVRSVQPNFRYLLQEQKPVPREGDPAQYALAKLRLPQAHTLARGTDVRIAVIDSGIDVTHPELAGSIVDTFDALGTKEGPHVHGTGIAGVIVSHARLMGGAPKAKILAIRAFGTSSGAVESSSYVVLKALDYAAAHEARIINMSFAGPKDALIERAMAVLAGRGIVLVAAAGNAGPKSPPLYPGANPHVIAVSATDEHDRLLPASNRGGYVALAAPGADIFLPAPDGKYQMTSGTSFSAAYVSALAALVLERNPALKPDEVRAVLTKTAHDLGSPGRDDLFGAGEADAFAAVQAVTPATATPAADASGQPGRQNAPEHRETPVVRAAEPPIAAVAAEKGPSGEAGRPAAR